MPRSRVGLRQRLRAEHPDDLDEEQDDSARERDEEGPPVVDWGAAGSAEAFMATQRTPWDDLATLQRELELHRPGTKPRLHAIEEARVCSVHVYVCVLVCACGRAPFCVNGALLRRGGAGWGAQGSRSGLRW
jgi:hypothetical protein